MQSLKLLLDENLSPKVAEWLRLAGIDAVHIRDRGLLEASDREVLEKAYTEDRILITANVGDFLKLARARDLHAGIVLLDDGGLLRDEQMEIILRAHAALLQQRDMVNRVLRISTDGKMRFEEIPPPVAAGGE